MEMFEMLDILEKVDRLSDVLVHVHNSDSKTLADLSDWFTKLSRLASSTAQWEMAVVSEAVARVLEKMRVTSATQECLMYLPGTPHSHDLSNRNATPTNLKTNIKDLIMTELCSLRYLPSGNNHTHAVLSDSMHKTIRAYLPKRKHGNAAMCVAWGLG
jgi:hypothetical protein